DPNAGYLPDGQPPPVTALSGAFHGRTDPVNQPAHQHSLPLARLLLEAGADPNDPQAVSNACFYPHTDAGLQPPLDRRLGPPPNAAGATPASPTACLPPRHCYKTTSATPPNGPSSTAPSCFWPAAPKPPPTSTLPPAAPTPAKPPTNSHTSTETPKSSPSS